MGGMNKNKTAMTEVTPMPSFGENFFKTVTVMVPFLLMC